MAHRFQISPRKATLKGTLVPGLDHLKVLVVDRNYFSKKPGKPSRSQFLPQHPSKMAAHVRHDVHRQVAPARPPRRSFSPQLILTDHLLPVPRVRRVFPVPSTSEPKKEKRHIMDRLCTLCRPPTRTTLSRYVGVGEIDEHPKGSLGTLLTLISTVAFLEETYYSRMLRSLLILRKQRSSRPVRVHWHLLRAVWR